MQKITLIQNSHSLTNFIQCEQLHAYADLCGFSVPEPKKKFERGTLVSRILQNYYYRKIKGKDQVVTDPLLLRNLAVKKMGVSNDEARLFMQTMIDYFDEYEDETWIPLAVEHGFSKTIYEDDKYLFVYEGRPDLIVKLDNNLIVVDHKTQGTKYDYFPYNNQVMGYIWSVGCNTFAYNYIKFTQHDKFRRSVHSFSDAQIEQWRSDTIEQYFRIAHAYEKHSFQHSWQCQSRFGTCDFVQVCTIPKVENKAWLLKTQYIQKERRKSWNR